jgi:fumarate reductase subunit D
MAQGTKRWKRSAYEPFWWSLFAAGGMMAAFFVPVHILIHGILLPLGAVPESTASYVRMRALIQNPLVRLYLLALISLPLFHAMHRFRTLLEDVGLKRNVVVVALCYAAAIAGTLFAAWTLLRA